MSTFYKFQQGVTQRVRVYSQNATLILKNSTTILTFNQVKTVDGEEWLQFKIDKENFIQGGIANYQLFEGDVLKEYGSCQIIPSLKVDADQQLRGRYKVIVQAIQKQLAGVATSAQKHVQVGDKTIDKYNAYDLMKILDYFKGKLAEEESGKDINAKTDQLTIKYYWRGF